MGATPAQIRTHVFYTNKYTACAYVEYVYCFIGTVGGRHRDATTIHRPDDPLRPV